MMLTHTDIHHVTTTQLHQYDDIHTRHAQHTKKCIKFELNTISCSSFYGKSEHTRKPCRQQWLCRIELVTSCMTTSTTSNSYHRRTQATCCSNSVTSIVFYLYNLLYNKSTTNQSNSFSISQTVIRIGRSV